MKISPDGKTIAFAVGQSRNWANEFSLAEVDIENGVEREITPEKFFNIKSLAWLPNQRGLLLLVWGLFTERKVGSTTNDQ